MTIFVFFKTSAFFKASTKAFKWPYRQFVCATYCFQRFFSPLESNRASVGAASVHFSGCGINLQDASYIYGSYGMAMCAKKTFLPDAVSTSFFRRVRISCCPKGRALDNGLPKNGVCAEIIRRSTNFLRSDVKMFFVSGAEFKNSPARTSDLSATDIGAS